MRFVTLCASLLVLPLAGLLFLQWPLREWVQAYSREANDLGQVLFALYVAVAIFAASQRGVHLAAHSGAPGHARAGLRWRVWAKLLCVGPWALFMLWAASSTIWQSVAGLERFAETLSAGYFVIKLAMGLLLLLVLLQALLAVWTTVRRRA
jgi:hypothetical protein